MPTTAAAAILAELVAIDSVNPALVPGGAGEREAAAWIAAWARDAGLDVEVHEATAGRPSVVVRAPGSGGGRSLLLCGHTSQCPDDPSPQQLPVGIFTALLGVPAMLLLLGRRR